MESKKWKISPTRHVARGHLGLNLHLSELVSDLTEPLVGNIECGCEVISMQDMMGEVILVNEDMKGWSESMVWEGIVEDKLVACGQCDMRTIWEYGCDE